MKVALDIRKSVDENASHYFELSKKAKKKIDGARKVINEHKVKLSESIQKEEKKESKASKSKKQEWFEKFRWFITSDGYLVIGGRDATTNEIIIKKYTAPDDIVFHTDMAGSPFVVVKREGKEEIPENSLTEAAQFTAAFSRGWKNGMATLQVFHTTPDNVTKTPNSGEFLPKGAFYIKGGVTNHLPKMEYAIGLYQDKIMGGPPTAVRKHCEKIILIQQGEEKTSDLAKQIKKLIGAELDEIMRALPQGCKIKKV